MHGSKVMTINTEGLASTKKTYEISKSLNFEWDFVISELISGFRVRFQIIQVTHRLALEVVKLIINN